MISPDFRLTFKRDAEKREGRYNLVASEGAGPYAPFIHWMPRIKVHAVVLAPWKERGSRKPTYLIGSPQRKNISSFFEPDPQYPGRAYGTSRDGRDAFLFRLESTAGTWSLSVMVFCGLGYQAASLFETWITDGVMEHASN